MRYFVIILLLIGTIIVAGISTPAIDAVPPLDSQFIYDTSEVILAGKVTSVNSTFSPIHNLYQIEVEKYLKNQLDTDTILAAGQNTVITKLGNQVFISGDRVLFFLNNDTIGYDKYTGVFGVSYESKIIEPQWDHCKIFEKSIPASHWVFGGRGPTPKISQQNNTDTENFLVGKEVLITYDMFNHTPTEKNIDVGIQIKNLDDPNSLYIYTEISQHLLKACTAYETLSWNFTPTKPGRYSIEFYDLKGSQMTVGFTARNSTVNKLQHEDSPLNQIKSGIKWHNVECRDGLELVEKKGYERSVCVTIFTKIELIVRGWAYDDRVQLGCTDDRVSKCYPNDPKEYRNKLYDYYFGKDILPSSGDYDFTVLHTVNACTDKPKICYGDLDNGTRIRVSCDYPIHGCGVKSFDSYTENRK